MNLLRVSQVGLNIALAGDPAIKYSDSFRMQSIDVVCFSVKAVGSAPKFSLYLAQSFDKPAIEGTYDAEKYNTQPDKLVSMDNVFDIIDTNWHYFVISPLALEYGVIKFVSNTGNGADTVLEWKLSLQEVG